MAILFKGVSLQFSCQNQDCLIKQENREKEKQVILTEKLSKAQNSVGPKKSGLVDHGKR